MEHHAGDAGDPLGGDADGEGLTGRLVGPHDHPREAGLDPEPRREVREVGQEHEKGHPGVLGGEGVAHDAVEVGDHREHGRGPPPGETAAQLAHQGPPPDGDEAVQDAEQGNEQHRPAPPQDQVVAFLERQAGALLQEVQGAEERLQALHPEAPGDARLLRGGQEGARGGAMAASRVDHEQQDLGRTRVGHSHGTSNLAPVTAARRRLTVV